MSDDAPEYLEPYRAAARVHGAGFRTLLWASPRTQRARFAALSRAHDFHDKRLLDVGAGRGDLLEYLLSIRVRPAEYIALEAVAELADAIEARGFDDCTVVRADFVADPARLFVGADAVVFSGSLNTLPPADFFTTLRRAFAAATEAVVFNFLADPTLAAARHLHWYRKRDIEAFARTLSPDVRTLDDYLDGDCTVCIRR